MFCSGRIRTLVAMTTYSFNRLTMKKVKLIISAVSFDIRFFFTDMFNEYSSMFCMTFVQIT